MLYKTDNPFSIVVHAVIILSGTLKSRNVSAGTLVEFTCATPETELASFTITTDVPIVNNMSNISDVILPSGDRQLTLSFIAPSKHAMLITIACIATRVNTMGVVEVNTSISTLMIQGKNILPGIMCVDNTTIQPV